MLWLVVLTARGEMGPTSQTDELSQPDRARETALRDGASDWGGNECEWEI